MANSKKDPSRAKKQQNFKEQAKKNAARGPKNMLIPETRWQSTDKLDLRGDLAEAFEKALGDLHNLTQHFIKVYQSIVQLNIQAEKITVGYRWDNGEEATAEEVKIFQEKMEALQKLRQQNAPTLQAAENLVNAEKSGLVTAEGKPLTEENLETGKKIIL